MTGSKLIVFSPVLLILALHLLLVQCAYNNNSYEPSPYEYGIIQQAALRNNSHNLIAGWRQYGDKLLYRGIVKQSYKFMGTTTASFRYPAWGNFNDTITCIMALDQYTGDTGGYANITSGGVGLKQVSLSFKSQFNRGIKHMIEIYGK